MLFIWDSSQLWNEDKNKTPPASAPANHFSCHVHSENILIDSESSESSLFIMVSKHFQTRLFFLLIKRKNIFWVTYNYSAIIALNCYTNTKSKIFIKFKKKSIPAFSFHLKNDAWQRGPKYHISMWQSGKRPGRWPPD